ncbi:MAG: PilZ domain-containing protein, partial [Novosphingobium sp.]|nr:PilZ domain-containing protein [Novosphingobium sp.]
TGLRCQCSEPPGKGAHVEIRYRGFSFSGSVQWSEADAFGIECDDTVDVALLVAGSPEVDVGRRALPRLEVRLPARLTVGEIEVPVVITDISPSGARLSLRSPPRRGVRGMIGWDGVTSPCTVVWSAKAECGVAFGEDIEIENEPKAPDPPLPVETRETTSPMPMATDAVEPVVNRDRPDRRAAHRIAVNWICEVHQADSRRVKVPLCNISTDGCEIGWFAGCREDLPLYLKMPNLNTIKAEVEWKDEHRIGCRFSTPLNRFVLDYLIANAAS